MIKKYSQTSLMLLAAGLLILVVSCDPARKYEKAETDSISSYLAANPTETFTKEKSGLYFFQVLAGTGDSLATNDSAFVQYTGKFLNGNTFDSNVGQADLGFPVGVGAMIAGFDEGIKYMLLGGKVTLLIPSSLAYGTAGYYTIPGYTPLLFDIELKRIKKHAK